LRAREQLGPGRRARGIVVGLRLELEGVLLEIVLVAEGVDQRAGLCGRFARGPHDGQIELSHGHGGRL